MNSLTPHNVNHMTDELSWLQQWYLEQCDGEWEHAFGVSIDTIDNLGWSVTICVEGTELASALFEPVKKAVSENNWVHCHVTERKEGAPPFGRGFASHSKLTPKGAPFYNASADTR